MNQLLLSEIYRPKSLDDIILLPRVKKIFENGLTQNVILYGHFGTGKTSLARILIGKYTKDKAFLELNSSFYTSIDILRSKIDDFCSKVYMGFDLDKEISKDDIKYVFLDEFERTSTQYQDALKAYIEEFSAKNVRFILTTNHINKVSEGIRSRLIEVNFDCQSIEEEKYLKSEIAKRISRHISQIEKFEIPKEDVVSIINKKFPDFRSIIIEVDNFRQTGSSNLSTSTTDLKIRNDLYSIVYDKTKNYEEIYHFLMNYFGPEKIHEVINLFGRPFIEYSLSEKKSNIEHLFRISHLVCEYNRLLETSSDPIIEGISFVGRIREIL